MSATPDVTPEADPPKRVFTEAEQRTGKRIERSVIGLYFLILAAIVVGLVFFVVWLYRLAYHVP